MKLSEAGTRQRAIVSQEQLSGSDTISIEDDKTHKKLPGFATTEGQDYEVKLSALLYARALNSKGEFQLATNVAGAGALDDIVFKFTTPVQVCHTAFIQLKHKLSARVNVDNLVSPRGDFSLTKYFEAYMDIKQSFKGEGKGLFSGKFETCHFAIFTNAPLHQGKGGVETRDLPSPVDEYIKLNEVKTSFTEDLVERLYSDLQTEEGRQKKECEKQKKTPIHPMSCNEEDAKDFLRRLKLFSGQPSGDQLDDVIKEELRKFGIKKKDLHAVYRFFLERMKTWWQQKDEGVILDQNSTILLEAHAEAMLPNVEKLSQQEETKFKLDVKFLESSTADMNSACADHALVHVVSEYSARLTASKVLQILEPQRDSYILLGTETLLKESRAVISAWSHGKKHLLVVISEESTNQEKEKDIVAELAQVLKVMKDKKMILISALSDTFALQVREKMDTKFILIQDSFHLEQLHQESIDSILLKKVIFQGQSTTLGTILGRDLDRVSNELKDVIETIIASESFEIGEHLEEDIEYYVPRTMQCKNIVKHKIFSDKNFAGRLIIHGASLADVDLLVPDQERRIKKRFQPISEGLDFNAYDENNEDGDTKSRDHVHHFEWIEGKLVWIKTLGDIRFVKKYVDDSVANTMQDPEDRVVLLIAEPGMGKTTLLAHEAQQCKQTHPGSWVVSITLSNHMSLLAKAKGQNINAEHLLSSALGLDKMPLISQALFRYSLNCSGNMIVYLDGVDEVAPRYTDEVLALITELLQTKVNKVWISSRQSVRRHLVTHLSKLAYTLKKFSEDDQRRFLVNYWKSNRALPPHDLNECISNLLAVTARSINDKERYFTGIPLQSRMLAEVFVDYILDKGNILPDKLNVLELIEQFVEKKFTTFNQKTLNPDAEAHPDYERILEEKRKQFIKKHSIIALLLLFGETDIESLIDKTKCEKFIKIIETGEERTGIVDRIVDGKPVFLHRVFAEYFSALWFSEHYHCNTEFMAKHILSESFGVVRHMFDRILARKNYLHNAVLSSDAARVEVMLKGGSDVNSTDKGGRTALHLAVIAGLHNTLEDKTNIQIMELLMTHDARWDMADKVLQWTPMQYADASKLWAEIDTLLKHSCVDKSLFITIKQYIDDEDVWENAVKHDYVNVVSLLLDISQTQTFQSSTVLEKIRFNLTHFNQTEFLRLQSLLRKSAEYGSVEVARHLIERTSGESSLTSNQQVGDLVSEPTISRTLISWLGTTALLQYFTGGGSSTRPRATSELLKNLLRAGPMGRNALMIASRHNSISVVKVILESFENQEELSEYVNARGMWGRSALWLASSGGYHDIVELLLTAGADDTLRDDDGFNGLLKSSYLGHVSVVNSLLAVIHDEIKRAEYVNLRNKKGRSALLCSSIEGNIDIVDLLLAAGADVLARDNDGDTGLIKASTAGHVSVVSSLLSSFSDESKKTEYVNLCNNLSESALLLAKRYEHSDIIDLLIGAGADDVTASDIGGDTELIKALRAGNMSEVTKLLSEFHDERKKSEYVNSRNDRGESALWLASICDRHDILRLLIASGAVDRARDNDGWTGLMIASKEGHESVVSSLLSTFRDDKNRAEYVKTRNAQGTTALWLASRWGHHDIVDILISSGADVTARDVDGRNELIKATLEGHVSVVKSLLDSLNDDRKKVYVNTCDNKSISALVWASKDGRVDIVEMLLAAGAEDKATQTEGVTALMAASEYGRTSVVKALLAALNDENKRAEYVQTRNKRGISALGWASSKGHQDIVQILKDSGAK